jgi:acetyl-CoA acyltransferase
MTEAVIVSAARTAVGKAPSGALHTVRPDEMAAIAKKAWEKRQNLIEIRAIAQGEMLPSFCGIVG